MQTILIILILFLLSIFSVLLYYKIKKSRLEKLQNGICPNCGAKPKVFFDPENRKFTIPVLEARLLKSHGCSGIKEIEYRCKECDHKEVHAEVGGGCGI